MNHVHAQDEEGLLSPWLRRRRFAAIAAHIPAGAVVLDLACGSGGLRHALPPGCTYFGVDRSSAAAAALGQRFLALDLAAPAAFATLARWLPRPPQVVTLSAILEHVADPSKLLVACGRLLPTGGAVIGTTPHPCSRRLHDQLARLGLCSREAAAEHETFLDQTMLQHAGQSAALELAAYRRFLCGLNQLFVYRRPTAGASTLL